MNYVVITGGASGLGLAMAKRWAKSGATLCLVDRDTTHRDEAVHALEALGAQVHFVCCDVTDQAQVDALKAYTDEHFKTVDVLINSAGVPTAGNIEAESMDAWQWVMNINLLGTVRVTKAFTAQFRKQKQGHIINVASQAGLTPMPMMGSYNASKAASIAFSETLKLEMAPFNVGVSVLCPAFVKTNLDQSLPDEQQAMQDVVTRLVQKGKITADEVAEATWQAVQSNRFLIVTHRFEKWIYRLKRWLPRAYYRLMIKRTRHFTLKGYNK